MPTTIILAAFLALLLYARHIDTERRQLRTEKRHAALAKRLAAVEEALPQVEAQYGRHSHSARYLRAAQYMTSLKLRNLTPRPTSGRTAMGGAR